jgi:ABC-type dipeptide/oligopeptide/nickel transport system ATPase subunit
VPLERPGPWTPASVYKLFPRLEERKGNRGRQLSGGEQEMLSIARALLINPKLLILDEPSQGLAPLIVREVFRIVAQMRAEGITVLLVEQNVRMSLEIADHAYVLSMIPKSGSRFSEKIMLTKIHSYVALLGSRPCLEHMPVTIAASLPPAMRPMTAEVMCPPTTLASTM